MKESGLVLAAKRLKFSLTYVTMHGELYATIKLKILEAEEKKQAHVWKFRENIVYSGSSLLLRVLGTRKIKKCCIG